MDDQETTTNAVVDAGAEQAQPVETTQAEAVQEDVTSEQQTSNEPSESQENPQGFDEDTLKWMNAKGIDPSSPEALGKLAKSAREAEKAMHSKAQKASELEKSLGAASDDYAEAVAEQTGENPEVLKRLQRMEVKEAVRDFWTQDGVDRKHEPKMVELLAQKPHLAGDLEALYALAAREDVSSLKSEGGREALESLAGKQRSAAPSGSATNTGVYSRKLTPENVDAEVAKMSPQEYAARRDEIRAVVGY